MDRTMGKTATNNSISLERFADMLREARAAFEAGDIDQSLKINVEFNSVGYSLVVSGGTLRLQNETKPQQDPLGRW